MLKEYGPYKLQSLNVVSVPEEVCDKLHLQAGDLVIWLIDDEGRCLVKKVMAPDLTGHLTARTGDGHAPPLSSSDKTFNLAQKRGWVLRWESNIGL